MVGFRVRHLMMRCAAYRRIAMWDHTLKPRCYTPDNPTPLKTKSALLSPRNEVRLILRVFALVLEVHCAPLSQKALLHDEGSRLRHILSPAC